jgi:hypothetical protein
MNPTAQHEELDVVNAPTDKRNKNEIPPQLVAEFTTAEAEEVL